MELNSVLNVIAYLFFSLESNPKIDYLMVGLPRGHFVQPANPFLHSNTVFIRNLLRFLWQNTLRSLWRQWKLV